MNFKSLYLWFGLPVLIILAWFFLVYLPMGSSMKNKDRAFAAIKNERQTVEGNIKNLMGEASSQKKLQESYDEFMGQTPIIDAMPEYVKSVSNLAKSRGLSVGSLSGYYSTLDVVQGAGLVNPVFEIGLRGGFLEMGRFLEHLSDRTAFRGIQAARIGYDEKAYPQLNGKFVIEFKALRGKKSESK